MPYITKPRLLCDGCGGEIEEMSVVVPAYAATYVGPSGEDPNLDAYSDTEYYHPGCVARFDNGAFVEFDQPESAKA